MEYEWFHLVPIIFMFFNFTNTKSDVLFDIVPKYQIKTIYYVLISLGSLFLLTNASMKHIEHALAIFSMSAGLKALKSQLTPTHEEKDYFYILKLSCMLISINYSLIPRTSTNVYMLYIYVICYGIARISLRKDTTANLLQDLINTHFIFFFSK